MEFFADGPRFHLEGIHCREQSLGRSVHLQALLSQAKPAAPALAQAHAQSCLELRHMLADAGRANAQQRLRRGKATASHDSFEDSQ
ncbi:hypothetical protein ACU4HD_42750 [Cupriavidus basilensis]